MALFASVNSIIPRSFVFKLLQSIPINQLFFASSSVEVYRLIKFRWKDLTKIQKQTIEKRIIQGPKIKLSEKRARERIDRCIFDLLGYMDQINIDLSDESNLKLDEIKSKFPNWRLVRKERAGFHFWMEWEKSVNLDPMAISEIDDKEIIKTGLKVEKKRFIS